MEIHRFRYSDAFVKNNTEYEYGSGEYYSDIYSGASTNVLTYTISTLCSYYLSNTATYGNYFSQSIGKTPKCFVKVGHFDTIHEKTTIQGVTGFQGLQGLQGIKSSDGLQGLQGRQGIQGNVGTGIQGIQGISGGGGGSVEATPIMNNVVFSSYYNSSGRCAETDIASYNGNLWVMATERIKIVIATENTTWMTNNILTNNGALPTNGGHYGVRFEVIKRGKWTGLQNYLFIPFDSNNMSLQTYNTTYGGNTVHTHVFTLNAITTKSLADSTIRIPTGYGYTHVFKEGSKIGNTWVTYLNKTVYIKGQANSLSTYTLLNNSAYSYNEASGIEIPITNRFSAKMRVVFCTYNDISSTYYQTHTIPVYINSVEFNLVIGLTKTEGDKADHYNGSTTSNSNSNIVFIRGKQSRGRIPFSMNDFGV